MPERAKVSSVETLESFRISLIIYLEKARGVLDQISDEVMRTRLWLHEDRRTHWENEVRRHAKALAEKQRELFSAKLSNLREARQAEQLAVVKTKRALNEAEDRLQLVKQWSRQYDGRVEPLAKEVDKLRDVLASHMGKAVAYLTQVTRTLGDYTELSLSDASPADGSTGEAATAATTVTPESKRGAS